MEKQEVEKTIFLFTRKATRTRENFGAHYINNHAPLGKRLTLGLLGYTVNLVQNKTWPDAVTEHWVRAAMDLVTPSISYATPEDFQKVLTDDQTLFDAFELYVVWSEKERVPSATLDSPLGEATPEAKAIWMYPDANALPPAPSGARRVVDNFVSHKLIYRDGVEWAKVPSDVAVFRMAWTSEPARLPADECLIVKEYRQIPAPVPNWEAAR
ncbi:MAG TPA: hypothetical protein VJS42_18555 [Steroidobacteraceae bacterium]|nr:hypothetical protein [Steroidobacteraceae bacterium]